MVFGNKGNAEAAFFTIIIRSAVAGEFDWRTHFLEHFQVVIEATFGDADLVGAVSWRAGGFQMDQIVQPDKAVQ